MFDDGRTVATGDTTVFVSEAGRPDGEPIVLLHGGLGSRHDFEPLAALLADDYRLIALDSRGHGRSAPGTAAMSYRQLAEDAADVLKTLDLPNAGIIGHSGGGIVALRLAAFGLLEPRFVVAVAAHWDLPEGDPTREIYAGVTAEEWRQMFAAQVDRYEAENPEPDFDRLFAATKAMWLASDDDGYPGERVRAIACPLLVVHGDEDFLVSRQQAFDLAERVEGARLLNLPFAAHTVLEDGPEEVVEVLKAFVGRVGEEL